MDEHTAFERAYKNGYEAGYEAGKRDAHRWIPVTERLPEKWQNVLAVRQDGKFRFDFIGSTGKWYEDVGNVGNSVTHWMPLPEPPKGSGEKA